MASEIDLFPHILSIGVLCVTLFFALFAAVHAARPTKFAYAGNNPKFWAGDVEKDVPLEQALAGQAGLYAQGIELNRDILAENHKYIGRALAWVLCGMLGAATLELIFVLDKIGKGGFGSLLSQG